MSNLSEEEIIKNLNNVLEKWQEIIKIEDKKEREIEMSMYFEEMPFYEIQGLLDLYNKEKEKNTELEEFNEHIKIFREENLSSEIDYVIALKSNFMGYLKTDYISKNKIGELKEFYIKDYKNRNITLIPLENLIKNINILLEEE